MTTNLDARLASYSSPALSIFRIVAGLMFILHGTQKLFQWPAPTPMPIPTFSWPAWWAGLIEVVVGVLVTVGFFTRIAAFIGAGEMAVAYFWMHWPPLEGPSASFWPTVNGGELALLYCFGFLVLATTGAGAWSIDARRRPAPSATSAAATAAPRRGFGRFRR
jgi:putative oxidoreductase